MLVRAGSPKAQEVAAAGLSELARGAVAELLRQQEHKVHQEELQMQEEEKARRLQLRKGAVFSTAGALTGDLPSAADGSMTNPAQGDPSAPQSASSEDVLEDGSANRLQAIADAGGIAPLVNLLGVGATTRARENAAGALWHLALDASNQIAIARANGIMPLVMLLEHEASALMAHICPSLLPLTAPELPLIPQDRPCSCP